MPKLSPYRFSAPPILSVHCPVCRKHAHFTFVTRVSIDLRADIEFFKQSNLFEYQRLPNTTGSRHHSAVFYPGLHGGDTQAITELPDGYRASQWEPPNVVDALKFGSDGSVSCSHCNRLAKHQLVWPDELYFAVEHKGRVLWAYHRESALELRDFLASSERRESEYRWGLFLRRVPTEFKHAKVRDTLVAKLDKLLGF